MQGRIDEVENLLKKIHSTRNIRIFTITRYPLEWESVAYLQRSFNTPSPNITQR